MEGDNLRDRSCRVCVGRRGDFRRVRKSNRIAALIRPGKCSLRRGRRYGYHDAGKTLKNARSDYWHSRVMMMLSPADSRAEK